eukprot:gnl/Chilomastix_cuspidata/420.p1 GENE.gnl/Chilomastix_cuspidata/420~~gnl/Chilomastix_cuspidata/420.p1  ORF type:complete len:469 (+),score=194.94 gnl/Chilomastix_cuspidata/420:1089-2495(+)
MSFASSSGHERVKRSTRQCAMRKETLNAHSDLRIVRNRIPELEALFVELYTKESDIKFVLPQKRGGAAGARPEGAAPGGAGDDGGRYVQEPFFYKHVDGDQFSPAYDLEPEDVDFHESLTKEEKRLIDLDLLEAIITRLEHKLPVKGELTPELIGPTFEVLVNEKAFPAEIHQTRLLKKAFKKIMLFWLEKRRAVGHRPLLPFLRPQTNPKSRDYREAFRPRPFPHRLPTLEKIEKMLRSLSAASQSIEDTIEREQCFLAWMNKSDEEVTHKFSLVPPTEVAALLPTVPVIPPPPKVKKVRRKVASEVAKPFVPVRTRPSRERAQTRKSALFPLPLGENDSASSPSPPPRKRAPVRKAARTPESFLLPTEEATDNDDFSWSDSLSESDRTEEDGRFEPEKAVAVPEKPTRRVPLASLLSTARSTVLYGIASMPWFHARVREAGVDGERGFYRIGLDGSLFHYPVPSAK